MCGFTKLTWEHKLVPLAFKLSYRRLGSIKLPLACRNADPSEPPLLPSEVPSMSAAAVPDIRGYVTWSQPISTDFPILHWHAEYVIYTAYRYERYFVDLSGEYKTYLSKFSPKSRSTLRRKLRKFTELSGGRIDWRVYRTPEELDEFFRLAASLSAKTYQERRLGKGLPADANYRQATIRLAANDRIRAYLIFLDAKPVAYLFCPASGNVLLYDKQGYDPEYAHCSPGTVLQMLALESLFTERKYDLFDFTDGEGEHKRFFANKSQLCGDIFMLDRRIWLIIAVFAHLTFSITILRIRYILQRVGFLGKVRRLLRS